MSRIADAEKKIAPAFVSGRISVISTAIVSALVLAAAGGFYVWRAISPATAQNQTTSLLSIPALPLPEHVSVAPGNLSVAEKPHAAFIRPHLAEPARLPAGGAPLAVAAPIDPPVTIAPPIHIEHSHESGAVDPVLLAAWQAYRDGEFDTALQSYSEVLRKDVEKRNPPNRDALLGMAAIAQRRSQDAIAAQYYSQVLALDPRDPLAHAGMSSLLVATGSASTESRLKLLLAQRPNAAALYFALGNHYAEQSRWSDAQQAYSGACELEADNAQFAFNLAVSLDHLGLSKSAAQYYGRALQLDSAGNASFDHAQTQLRLDELTRS